MTAAPRRRFTAISLFSGAMGLDLGVESTGGFDILACVEKDAAACATIRANREAGRLPAALRVYEQAVEDVDPLRMLADLGLAPGEVDLVIGGPPCQAFSSAGKRGSVADPRGTLLWHFLRFVAAARPRFFVMENVRALVSAPLRRPARAGAPTCPEEEPGSVVRAFADDLRGIGGAPYHLDIFEVNAVNYGAPQLRERALFVGNRMGAEVDLPDPTHVPPTAAADDPRPRWRTLGDAVRGLGDPDPAVLDFSARKKAYLAKVPSGGNWRSLSADDQRASMGAAWRAKGGRSGWWRRLSFDLPCPTLLTMPNHASTSLCHPVETRALSVREYAAVQEFPADWTFVGTLAERYRQIGNAVPTRLGAVAGEAVLGKLRLLARRAWEPLAEAPAEFRVIYLQSHVRSRTWYRGGEAVVRGADGGVRAPAARTVRRHRMSV